MNQLEVAQLLTRASAVDNRVISEETVAAWWDVLKFVPYADAVEALLEHHRTSEEYLRPAHITAGARRAKDRRERDARIERALNPAPKAEVSYEPPQCEHGMNVARCMPCAKRLAESN